MNRSQILLLLTLLCFGLSSCGLTGLDNYREAQKTTSGLEEKADKERIPQSIISIKNQIEKHWRPPVNAKGLKDVRVVLHITLNKNGSVKDASIKDVICPPNANETCKITAESCIKVVKEISPYKLRDEEYDTWKEFNMLFDPSAIAEDEKPTRNVYVEVPKD